MCDPSEEFAGEDMQLMLRDTSTNTTGPEESTTTVPAHGESMPALAGTKFDGEEIEMVGRRMTNGVEEGDRLDKIATVYFTAIAESGHHAHYAEVLEEIKKHYDKEAVRVAHANFVNQCKASNVKLADVCYDDFKMCCDLFQDAKRKKAGRNCAKAVGVAHANFVMTQRKNICARDFELCCDLFQDAKLMNERAYQKEVSEAVSARKKKVVVWLVDKLLDAVRTIDGFTIDELSRTLSVSFETSLRNNVRKRVFVALLRHPAFSEQPFFSEQPYSDEEGGGGLLRRWLMRTVPDLMGHDDRIFLFEKVVSCFGWSFGMLDSDDAVERAVDSGVLDMQLPSMGVKYNECSTEWPPELLVVRSAMTSGGGDACLLQALHSHPRVDSNVLWVWVKAFLYRDPVRNVLHGDGNTRHGVCSNKFFSYVYTEDGTKPALLPLSMVLARPPAFVTPGEQAERWDEVVTHERWFYNERVTSNTNSNPAKRTRHDDEEEAGFDAAEPWSKAAKKKEAAC